MLARGLLLGLCVAPGTAETVGITSYMSELSSLIFGRRLQQYSGTRCVRNCQNLKLCNLTETKQAQFCTDTCACGKYQMGTTGGEAGETWSDADEWMPSCLIATKKPAQPMIDAACKGPRVLISGLMSVKANGEYRMAGVSPTSCSAGAGPNTVYKQHGGQLYLYRIKHAAGLGWYISPKPCSEKNFFARYISEEGANVGMVPYTSRGCQHGFEGTCAWRECIDKQQSAGGFPTCFWSSVPNNAYGFIRAPYNRAMRVRPADQSKFAYRKCLGDFNEDGTVSIKELMEVLAGYGVKSCSLRADLDNNCKIDVHDVLLLLSHFGNCKIAKAAATQPYELAKILVSGFQYKGANGKYELKLNLAACAGSPPRPAYQRMDGGMYMFPTKAQKGVAPSWVVAEHPCRDDIAYAMFATKDTSSALEVKNLPCQHGADKTKACFWQECSKAQYLKASCQTQCPKGKFCPPLMRSPKSIEVIPIGTHMDSWLLVPPPPPQISKVAMKLCKAKPVDWCCISCDCKTKQDTRGYPVNGVCPVCDPKKDPSGHGCKQWTVNPQGKRVFNVKLLKSKCPVLSQHLIQKPNDVILRKICAEQNVFTCAKAMSQDPELKRTRTVLLPPNCLRVGYPIVGVIRGR